MPSSAPERRPDPLPFRRLDDPRETEQTLPRPLTTFLGRETETERLRELVLRPDVRLVTVTGPGGAGKTRIAIYLAERLSDQFASCRFVALAAIRDTNLFLPAIAQALGVREGSGQTLDQRLAAHLADGTTLLVLDNLEQVVEAAPRIANLLARCPDLTVIATSRTVLHVSGEHDFPLPPLDLPAGGATAVHDVADASAVALFVQRAQAANPTFSLTAANAATVRDICIRLDGLPLAIELAAAHSRALAPAALLVRLANPLNLLAGGPRDQPPRLRAIRDAIAWGYDLLDPSTQALFRRLSVLVDGFTLEAAEAVSRQTDSTADRRPPPVDSVWDGIEVLIDASLLAQEAQANGEPRFRMLETIREFGLERLAELGEEADARDAQMRYILDLAEQAETRLIAAGASDWVERLAEEWANLRVAIAWALETGRPDGVMRLAGTLLSFAYARGEPAEPLTWLEAALKQRTGDEKAREADALFAAAALAQVQGAFDRSLALSDESLIVSRSAGYLFGEARALLGLGITDEWQGELELAAARYAESGRLMAQLDDSARLHHWQVLPVANLADVALLRGNPAEAIALGEEAVRRWRDVGYIWGVAQALGTVAAATFARGDFAQAARLYAETLDHWLACNDGRGIAGTLAGIAEIAAARGQLERAARLLGAAWTLADRLGIRFMAHHVNAERIRANLRHRLDEPGFGTAWEAGKALGFEAAVADARGILADAASRSRGAHDLTVRQLDVLRLLADGLPDREIADRLSISPRTVQTHVAGLFGKLGASSRAEAAALAVRRGLV